MRRGGGLVQVKADPEGRRGASPPREVSVKAAGGRGRGELKPRGKLTDPLGQEVVVDGKKIGRLRKGRASVDPAYRGKARGSTRTVYRGEDPGRDSFPARVRNTKAAER